jgi:class 3 adenylate cyclase
VRVVSAGGARPGSAIHPVLADAIAALSGGGYWAIVFDARWSLVAHTGIGTTPGGEHFGGGFHFGPDASALHGDNASTANTPDEKREALRHLGGWILSDLAVGRDELREMVHPALRDIVDELEVSEISAITWRDSTSDSGLSLSTETFAQRVRDASGRVVGTVLISKPAVPMNTMAMLCAVGDLEHLQRMAQFAELARRPAAVLFADLEGSTQLAKVLPTAAYFAMIRRITRAADQCIIDSGGLVGRHAGDGVAAFFAAETDGSESAAGRRCITAARAIQTAMAQIAERHHLDPHTLAVRAGLHWGATLYIGSIITPGRTEVTALGDEVNETARIEACATDGRMLASKHLIERLDRPDAAALGIDPNHVTYTQLADLDTATDKARRDAPAVPVYDLNLQR